MLNKITLDYAKSIALPMKVINLYYPRISVRSV